MDWQPIETAPQGETVLIYCPYTHQRGGRIGLGLLRKYLNENAAHWSFDGSRVAAQKTPPTHWMPIPAAPHSTPERRKV